MPDLNIPAIANTESGSSVRAKLNLLLNAIRTGTLISESEWADSYEAFRLSVLSRLNDAESAQNDAATDIQGVLNRLTDVEEMTAGLSAEQLALAQDLVDAIGNLDLSAIEDLTGIAVAGISPNGWVRDPTFRQWASGNLQRWFTAGVTTWGAQDATGAFGSGLRFVLPSGSPTQAQVVAASSSSGQTKGVDLAAEFVVASLQMRAFSGDLSSAYLRVEWRNNGTWYRGHAFGATNSLGWLVANWGLTVDPNRLFSREIVFQRPTATADAVRLTLTIKSSTATGAADVRVDLVDMRAATEAEIKAHQANAYAATRVDSLALSILGPTGALEALRTDLTAAFGEADATISETVAALSTAQGSQAIKISNLEATYSDGNLVRNPDFADGPYGIGIAPAWWSGWPATWRVIPRGFDSNTAVINAPTRNIVLMPMSATDSHAATGYEGKARPGDRLNISFRAATGGSPRDVSLRVRIQWLNGAGAEIAPGVGAANNLAHLDWREYNFDAVGPAPEGTERVRVLLQRLAGGSGLGYSTQIDVRKIDNGARAAIDVAQAAAATANGSIATMQARVSASFDNWDAFVSQLETAVVTEQRAASALVFRAVAGGGNAAVKLTAWDDQAGTGAAILLDAGQVIAPGTLGAGEIVISDLGFNMVPDDQLQSRRVWGNSAVFELFTTTSHSGASSLGELRSVVGGTGICWGRSFPVRGEQVLTCSCEIARTGGTSHNARGLIRYFGAAGAEMSAERASIGGTGGDVSSAALIAPSSTRTVPVGAKSAQIGFEVLASAGGGRVRFFAPSVVRRSAGSTLITPDAAFFNMLTAQTAWIGNANIIDLSVGTLKIAGGAIGRSYSASRSTDVTLPDTGVWENIISMTMPANMMPTGVDARVFVTPFLYCKRENSNSWTIGIRVLVGGVVVYSDEYDFGSGTDRAFLPVSTVGAIGNGESVLLQARRVSGAPQVVSKATMSTLILFQAG